MRDRITVYRTAGGYVARFHDDADVVRLFGTDTLPTPFTKDADPVDVLDVIREKNPGAVVRMPQFDGSVTAGYFVLPELVAP